MCFIVKLRLYYSILPPVNLSHSSPNLQDWLKTAYGLSSEKNASEEKTEGDKKQKPHAFLVWRDELQEIRERLAKDR